MISLLALLRIAPDPFTVDDRIRYGRGRHGLTPAVTAAWTSGSVKQPPATHSATIRGTTERPPSVTDACRAIHYGRLMRVLVDASNLHVGGAVVVAASFIDEVVQLHEGHELEWIDELRIRVSSEVADELYRGVELKQLQHVKLALSSASPSLDFLLPSRTTWDAKFTVFGPSYSRREARLEVTGFADGSLFPTPHTCMRKNHLIQSRARRLAKLRLLRRYDAFVVETPAMAANIRHLTRSRPTYVVPNVVSATYRNPARWQPIPLPNRPHGAARVFYPAGGYPHKNHALIPAVCDSFARLTGRSLEVVTTLARDEMASIFPNSPAGVVNLGRINSATCAYVYSQTDALFFPSSNETFSSAPIEAMLLGKAVVAALNDFTESFPPESYFGFAPGDSDAAAYQLAMALDGSGKETRRVLKAQEWSKGLPTPTDRARAYFALLRELGE